MTNDSTQNANLAHYPMERLQTRANFVRDGIAAWNAYQATGLHVTEEEADLWLSKLESGLDVLPPLSTEVLARSREV